LKLHKFKPLIFEGCLRLYAVVERFFGNLKKSEFSGKNTKQDLRHSKSCLVFYSSALFEPSFTFLSGLTKVQMIIKGNDEFEISSLTGLYEFS
jgi:hypothetical protein